MNVYNRHYLAFRAAQRLWLELKDELPVAEQNPMALLLLETYLAASDRYRFTQNLEGHKLLIYLRSRAAQYYEVHYEQSHHDCWQSLRLRGRLELALVQAVGNDINLLWYLTQWHSLRFASAINMHLFVGKLLLKRDEMLFEPGQSMVYITHLN